MFITLFSLSAWRTYFGCKNLWVYTESLRFNLFSFAFHSNACITDSFLPYLIGWSIFFTQNSVLSQAFQMFGGFALRDTSNVDQDPLSTKPVPPPSPSPSFSINTKVPPPNLATNVPPPDFLRSVPPPTIGSVNVPLTSVPPPQAQTTPGVRPPTDLDITVQRDFVSQPWLKLGISFVEMIQFYSRFRGLHHLFSLHHHLLGCLFHHLCSQVPSPPMGSTWNVTNLTTSTLPGILMPN